MKQFLLWSFERGSIQYDVICAVILAFIFLTPSSVFHDRPDFMRVPNGQAIRQTSDDAGHTVFTVKVDNAVFARKASEEAAVDRLKAILGGGPFTVSRAVPVYDTIGVLVAYSIWIDQVEK